MKDYIQEYYEILKKIENLINNGNIPKKKLRRLLPYIKKFTLDINKNYSNYEYLLNLSNLTYIYEKLSRYNTLPLEDTKSSKENSLENSIFRTKHKLIDNDKIINKLLIELTTCITIITTLISIPINFIKNNEENKDKKLYSTSMVTYLVIEDITENPLAYLDVKETRTNNKSDDRLLYEYYEDSRDTLKVSTKYLEQLPYTSNFIIKKYFPWEINNNIASRKVVTYEISDEIINNLLINDNLFDLSKTIYSPYVLDYIINNSKITEGIETKNSIEVNKTSRIYNQEYYEFMSVNQNLDDYIKVNNYHYYIDLMLMIFAELILYALIVETYNDSLLATCYKKIVALKKCYKFDELETKKLNKLLSMYQKLTPNKKENNLTKKRVLN